LGIRVVSGFMIGFPEDTRQSIREVLRYAKQVNPYAANFNVCTPYPGTGFIGEIQDKIASRDWSRYDVYTPNLKYEHLTTEEVAQLHRDCFRQYYWRWAWLRGNWQFLMPRLNAAVSGLSRWFQPTPASSQATSAEGGAATPAVARGGNAPANVLPIVDAGPVAGDACHAPSPAPRKAA
jgi:hypothetical protein